MDVVAGVNSNWKTADCFDYESFGCEVDVGTHIHDIPKPDLNYHCQQPDDTQVSFKIYTDDILKDIFPVPQCYLQPHQNLDSRGVWDFCVEYCTNQTSVPASVHSQGQNNFVTALLQERTWLGMNNIQDGRLPSAWQFDNTPVDYSAFKSGFPIDTDPLRTALIISHKEDEFGMWKNVQPANPSYPRNCFCQKPSIPGNPEPPGYPEIPISELCDANWIYMISTGRCVYHDIHVRAWQSAEQNCASNGGHLLSINSPDITAEILDIGNIFHDPTSYGTYLPIWSIRCTV